MATGALLDACIYVGSHDFTGDSNRVSVSAEAAANDKSTFRSGGWREYNMGAKSGRLEAAGFWGAGADSVDETGFSALGQAGTVVTVANSEVEGHPAILLQSIPLQYAPLSGAWGENAGYSLAGQTSDGASGLIRGHLLKKMGAASATGQLGTVVQVGAVGAAQHLYATFHIFGTAGTTITAVIESDDNAGFTSGTTRMTLGPYTTAGGRWATRVPGPITDTYWRARVTAITGTFTVASAIGIQ